jgi:asparagine synthase (glutamine-hydrolysing)
MAVSLEARAPYLDHRGVEFAAHLPVTFKIRGTEAKWLPRQVLYRYVPPALVDRPKRGFGPPIAEWLRNAFRGWAESLLFTGRLRAQGFLDAGIVGQLWRQHLAGSSLWTSLLWNILMFEAWLDEHSLSCAETDIDPRRVTKSVGA